MEPASAHPWSIHATIIDDSSHRDFCQPAKSQQAIVDNSRREFLQQEIGGNSRRDFHPQVKSPQAKCQQAIDGFAVELSQTTVCEIFALAKTDRPAGRFNRACISMRELCCISSIQSATTVGEIFANRQKAIRRSMATAGELCFNSSIQSATTVDEIFTRR